MRADIHDGPEHMLKSETEYIDARPHQPASTKASCTARPDHTLGFFQTSPACPAKSALSLRADIEAVSQLVGFGPTSVVPKPLSTDSYLVRPWVMLGIKLTGR